MKRFLGWSIFLALAALVTYLLWLPDVKSLTTTNPKRTTLMELRDQQALAAGQKPHNDMRWRPLSEISPHLIHAIVLSEDDTFYQHAGFDVEQIRIAIQRDWDKKQFVYGGSTITQQLARTLYLSPRKNLLRKAKEAVLTLVLEHTLTKRRILEIYLNVIEWGRGIYGAEAAAQHYFHVSASDLSPDQAVALVSVLPSPRRWSPLSERNFMARRRLQLTNRMQRAGYWPAAEVSSDTFLNGDSLLLPDPLPLDPDTEP